MTAREYFQAARDAALAQRRLSARVAAMRASEGLRAARFDGMPRASGASDPMDAVASRIDAEADARRDMAAYARTLADARALCRGVRRANPSMRWGDVLEARFCDAMDWATVARVCYVSESRARADASAAMDWVDMVGIAAAREGCGHAEIA